MANAENLVYNEYSWILSLLLQALYAMDSPKVSLIVPTYAREEPLRRTLADAIAQDYPDPAK